jgi:hypothetical protein
MVPLSFSKRLTASAAVFPCIFIASPQGAQMFSQTVATTSALALEYAELTNVYPLLRQQDVPNQQEVLYANIATATTIVAALNTTIQTIMAQSTAGFVIRGMQIVVANALASLKRVQFDEA